MAIPNKRMEPKTTSRLRLRLSWLALSAHARRWASRLRCSDPSSTTSFDGVGRSSQMSAAEIVYSMQCYLPNRLTQQG
jgi:hypothetical protein